MDDQRLTEGLQLRHEIKRLEKLVESLKKPTDASLLEVSSFCLGEAGPNTLKHISDVLLEELEARLRKAKQRFVDL